MGNQATSQARPYLKELDSWRAIAVLFVIIAHLLSMNEVEPRQFLPFISKFGLGVLGVHIFFLISGFVICRSLLHEENAQRSISFKGFYLRRFFRIVPTLLSFLLVVTFLGSAGQINHTFFRSVTAAMFMCNFPNADCWWFVAHTWSLAYEEQFYLIFPLIFANLGGSRTRALWLVFFTLLAGAFLRDIFHWQGQPYGLCFSLLLFGVLCAKHEDTFREFSKNLPTGSSFIIIFALVGPYVLYPNKYITVFHYLTVHCCIAILIFRSLGQQGLIGALFRNRGLRYVGKISYGLYLWQQLFTPPQGVVPWSYLFGIPALILIPVASYHLMEQPLIRFGKRLGKRNEAGALMQPEPMDQAAQER